MLIRMTRSPPDAFQRRAADVHALLWILTKKLPWGQSKRERPIIQRSNRWSRWHQHSSATLSFLSRPGLTHRRATPEFTFSHLSSFLPVRLASCKREFTPRHFASVFRYCAAPSLASRSLLTQLLCVQPLVRCPSTTSGRWWSCGSFTCSICLPIPVRAAWAFIRCRFGPCADLLLGC